MTPFDLIRWSAAAFVAITFLSVTFLVVANTIAQVWGKKKGHDYGHDGTFEKTKDR